MATFEEEYKKYSTSGQGKAVNDLYDAKQQSQLTQLESAYQASRAEAEAARDKLPGQYRQQANDLAALWKAQNPDLAYNTGRMSAEEYKAVTGKYPKGYTAPRSGGAAAAVPGGDHRRP